MTQDSGLRTQDPVLVIKIGGSTLGAEDTTLDDVVALQQEGVPLVVVHGGGPAVTSWMDRQGLEARFVRGLRVTDEASLEIVVAVLAGLVNKQLVAEVNARGGRAAGICGADGPTVLAEVTDPEYGRVGQVREVRTALLRAMLAAGVVPFLSPVGLEVRRMSDPADGDEAPMGEAAAGDLSPGPFPLGKGSTDGASWQDDRSVAGGISEKSEPSADQDSRFPSGKGAGGLGVGLGRLAAGSDPRSMPVSPLLNINADTVAGEVAAALGASRLIFLTDVPGVKGASGEFVASLSGEECEALIRSGAIGGGMIPKVEACLSAADAGAEALIVDGREPHALRSALRGEARGTRVG